MLKQVEQVREFAHAGSRCGNRARARFPTHSNPYGHPFPHLFANYPVNAFHQAMWGLSKEGGKAALICILADVLEQKI